MAFRVTHASMLMYVEYVCIVGLSYFWDVVPWDVVSVKEAEVSLSPTATPHYGRGEWTARLHQCARVNISLPVRINSMCWFVHVSALQHSSLGRRKADLVHVGFRLHHRPLHVRYGLHCTHTALPTFGKSGSSSGCTVRVSSHPSSLLSRSMWWRKNILIVKAAVTVLWWWWRL
jgi:hypothetical protein